MAFEQVVLKVKVSASALSANTNKLFVIIDDLFLCLESEDFEKGGYLTPHNASSSFLLFSTALRRFSAILLFL